MEACWDSFEVSEELERLWPPAVTWISLLYWLVLFRVSSCPLPAASAIPSQRTVASGSALGEPDRDGDEWEPVDCGLLLGYCGLCPRPQTQTPGQGAPPPHYLPLPHPARACGHTQGEPRSREREIAGPQNIMEENQALPLGAWLFLIRWGREQNEPQDPRWRHLGVEGGDRSPRVGGERPGAGPAHPHGPWRPGTLSCGVYDQAWPWASRPVRQPIESQIISITFYCPRITTSTNPEYSLEGLMLKLMCQYFGHLMQEPTH